MARAIKAASVLAFADMGMEAIYEFEVKDMPATVAVDARGTSVHATGPEEWRRRIAERVREMACGFGMIVRRQRPTSRERPARSRIVIRP